MANFFAKLFGTKSQRDLKQLNPILDKCLAAYDEITKLSNDDLRAKTAEFNGVLYYPLRQRLYSSSEHINLLPPLLQ